MTEHDASQGRIGRPPKVDAAGTPTRERLLRAAVDACVECGYEGDPLGGTLGFGIRVART